MAIKTLIRDYLPNHLEIIIEKSDNGKLFFGVLRDDPRTRECYTFDAAQMPGRLLELNRDSIVSDTSGAQIHVDFNIVIDPKRYMISCSSRSHPRDCSRTIKEIERAYTFVSMYRKQFMKDTDKISKYPEVACYLSHIGIYPKEVFGREYKIC